jgi:hypothetical protein
VLVEAPVGVPSVDENKLTCHDIHHDDGV